MRKFILISYDFPPNISAESTMMENYVENLSKFGWSAVVICRKEKIMNDKESFNSFSNLPSNTIVYRTSSLEQILFHFFGLFQKSYSNSKRYDVIIKKNIHGLLSKGKNLKLLKSFKVLDNRVIGWLPFIIIASMKAQKKNKIDLIISRSGTISSHIAGLMLKFFMGLPWIASFSDPWTTDPNRLYRDKIIPERILKWYDEKVERLIVYKADILLFTTEQQKQEYIQRFQYIPRDKFRVIPNSCNIKELCKPNNIWEKNDRFILTYTGIFANTRSPEPFLYAVKLLQDEIDIRSKVLIRFIGDLGVFEHLVHKYKLDALVEIIEMVPHNKIFNYLYNSDMLLLIDSPEHYMCLPSKLVEYIFVEKPILAITSKVGASADVISKTKTGMIVSPDNIADIKNALKDFLIAHENGTLQINPDWTEIEKYNAERCTESLVKIIEQQIKK